MNNYNLGNGGVNIVKNPTQLADNELTSSKNAEYQPDAGTGGEGAITKRGGLAKLFSGALGGAVLGMIGTGLEPIPVSTWTPDAYIQEFTQGSGVITTTIVGGQSDEWEPLADSDDATYLRSTYSTASPGGASDFIEFELRSIPDPGHNTGFTLKFRGRRSAITTGNINTASLHVGLYGTDFSTSIIGVSASTSDLTTNTSFTEYSIALAEADVIALRAADGFQNGLVRIFSTVILTVTPGALTQTFTFDVSRIWIDIEAP